MTWRQWWLLLRLRLWPTWFVANTVLFMTYTICLNCAPLTVLALSTNFVQVFRWELNPWVPALGLFFLFWGIMFDQRRLPTPVSCLPISRASIGRHYWLTKVLLAVIVGLLSPVFWLFLSDVHDFPGLRWIAVNSPQWRLLPILTLFEATFVGICSWRHHPRLKKYSYAIVIGVCLAWSLLPLHPTQWNSAHITTITAGIFLTVVSCVKADLLFVGTKHELLRRKRALRDSVGFQKMWKPRYLPPFQIALPEWWLFSQIVSTMVIGLGLWRWLNELPPVDSRMGYLFFLIPLGYAWPHDLSVFRSMPIAAHTFVANVTTRYLLSTAVIAAAILGLSAVMNEPWYIQRLTAPIAIIGYGFLARLVLWSTAPERLFFEMYLTVAATFVGLLAITASPEIAEDPLITVFIPMITAPLALAIGVWGLHRAFRNYMPVCNIRSSTKAFWGNFIDYDRFSTIDRPED